MSQNSFGIHPKISSVDYKTQRIILFLSIFPFLISIAISIAFDLPEFFETYTVDSIVEKFVAFFLIFKNIIPLSILGLTEIMRMTFVYLI